MLKRIALPSLFCILLLALSACAQATQAPAAPEPTPIDTPVSAPVPTLAPPLADVDFPDQVVAYPADWPAELRYPDTFQPADFSFGKFPGSELNSWSLKLRYAGPPSEAAQMLADFFGQKGWTVAERSNLDSGGTMLILENGDTGGGILVVDADSNKPGSTLVLSTLYLQ